MTLSEPKEARPASPPSGRTSDTIAAPAADTVSQESSTEPKKDHVKSEASVAEAETTGAKTWVIMISVLMATFLVALDRSIISTACGLVQYSSGAVQRCAIPAITNEFNSLSGYGWYGSAYLLTSCAFQLLFGKVYTFFPVKTVLLLSILLFEASSALCGAAPNSTAFIIGRAFCGVSSSGIFAGSVVCIVYIIPLHVRPKIQGAFGAFFGVAGISGPLIGGALTTNVTWRWCFYLNLPIGGAAMAVIAILLKIPDQETTKLPLSEKLRKLDFPGTALFIPGVVCLLLALEWGGQTYPWGEWRIILLLVLAGVCLLGFTAVQIWMPTTATLPPRFFKQRSILSALLATFGITGGNYIYIYYLPTWFQSVQGVDSAQSGIRLLPLMITMIIGSILGGISNTKIGYYTPLAIIGSCVMSVGAGLITTFWVDTPQAEWIGYQVIYGIGMGLCFQVPNLAVQAVMAKADQPVGLSLMLFCNLLSSTVFVSVGANVLNTQLLSRLSRVPGFESSLVASGGATSLVDALPAAYRDVVLAAYNTSLQKVFQIALILCCISVIGCATLEWKNVKQGKDNMATAEAAAEAGQKDKAGGVAPAGEDGDKLVGGQPAKGNGEAHTEKAKDTNESL